MRNLLLTGLQLGTSITRLAAFAFSVIMIGRVSGNPTILLAIGYLPFLAFFDILIQSGSRAAHLRGVPSSDIVAGLRHVYALVALALIAIAFVSSLSSTAPCYLLLLGAWPLGALGFVWERLIAQHARQWLLSGTELLLLTVTTALYQFVHLPWQILLLTIISFPLARLVALAVPLRSRPAKEPASTTAAVAVSTEMPSPDFNRRWVGGYIGASLAQQLIAASATSLPAIYAQLAGEWNQLSVNLALFRSFHSFAAIVSLTINAMSSRIFYRQTGAGFENLEMRILDNRGVMASIALALVGLATVLAVSVPGKPILFGFAILPVMAMVNAESSMLYNRGLPMGTLHCQVLILILSAGFLSVLINHPVNSIVALAGFVAYAFGVLPRIFASHRAMLGRSHAG